MEAQAFHVVSSGFYYTFRRSLLCTFYMVLFLQKILDRLLDVAKECASQNSLAHDIIGDYPGE
ncbi:unnamed protein product [Trichobilharzia szidati]|nr:unnamed protein product [Trichobilharzia szidati]